MTAQQLLSFVVAAELLLVIPGPSVLFTISRGVTYGRRAAVANVAGNASGALVQATLVAAGLGAVVATSTTVFSVVKLVGAVYVAYLGVRAFQERRSLGAALHHDGGSGVRATRTLFATASSSV